MVLCDLCPRHDIIGYSNECLLSEFPRARWMKMSKKYWSKSSPCVRTSPRRSKAGHWPLVVHLMLDPELLATTAIVLFRGITVTLVIELLPFPEASFWGWVPGEDCPPQNRLETSKQQGWKMLSSLLIPELGSSTLRSQVPMLAAGIVLGTCPAEGLHHWVTHGCTTQPCFRSYAQAVPLSAAVFFLPLVSYPQNMT